MHYKLRKKFKRKEAQSHIVDPMLEEQCLQREWRWISHEEYLLQHEAVDSLLIYNCYFHFIPIFHCCSF